MRQYPLNMGARRKAVQLPVIAVAVAAFRQVATQQVRAPAGSDDDPPPGRFGHERLGRKHARIVTAPIEQPLPGQRVVAVRS